MKAKDKKFRILAAGDLHGSEAVAERLSIKAKKEKVDLVVLAGDLNGSYETEKPESIVEPFRKNKQKVVFVPGNWDSSLEVGLISNLPGIKNVDGYYVSYNGHQIVGVGCQDFMLFPNEKRTFSKLQKNFEKIKTKSGKKILVSHLHAANTGAEFSGIPGDVAIRKAIEKFKPDVFISAHIHEAEGIEEKIGKTKVFQVGKKGKIIDL